MSVRGRGRGSGRSGSEKGIALQHKDRTSECNLPPCMDRGSLKLTVNQMQKSDDTYLVYGPLLLN